VSEPQPIGDELLARTPLFECHVAAGARLVEFAGYEMPVYYGGSSAPVNAEHVAVRTACGIFDVSHMGQIEVSGPQAAALLARVLSNDIRALDIGGAQYSVICSEDGGVLDDVLAYRVGESRYLVVVNAANAAGDLRWFQAHAPDFDAEVCDRSAAYAMIAVQGPTARRLVGGLALDPLPPRRRVASGVVAGVSAVIAGTGYTGEDGVELLCDPGDATKLWSALAEAGARPAGLGARDTLRIEACLPLYGHELSLSRGPVEAGLSWCCRAEASFIGGDAIEAVRASGPRDKLVALRVDGPGIPRQGNPIVGGGEVCSGTLSPCLQVGIGLAYVPAEAALEGGRLEIDVRGRLRPATIVARPFVKGSA
jgi:aminomethyltransferase